MKCLAVPCFGTGFGFLLLQGESMTMGTLTWDNIKLGWLTYTLRGSVPYHHGATFWCAGSYGPGEGAEDFPILQLQHEMVWVTISRAWLKETSVFIPVGHNPPRPHLLLMLLYLWIIFFPPQIHREITYDSHMLLLELQTCTIIWKISQRFLKKLEVYLLWISDIVPFNIALRDKSV